MQQLKQTYSSYDSYVYLRVTFWESTGRAESRSLIYIKNNIEKMSSQLTTMHLLNIKRFRNI